jgi:hypothetical protein
MRVPRPLPAIALAALLAGCAAPPPRYPIHNTAYLMDTLRARNERFHSLRATGSADQFGRGQRVRGSVVIFVQQPDKIHVDTFAFGNLVSSLVSNGERFTLLQGQRFLVGPARPCVALQLLGIPMEGRDLVTILSGGTPLIGERMSPPRWEHGRYVVDVHGADGATQRIEFDLPPEQRDWPADRQTPLLRRVVLRDREGQRAEITYGSYRQVAGTPFPDRVRVQMPREHVDTQLNFDEVEPNFTIPPDPVDPDAPPPDPFRVEPPAGAQVQIVNC